MVAGRSEEELSEGGYIKSTDTSLCVFILDNPHFALIAASSYGEIERCFGFKVFCWLLWLHLFTGM